MDHIVVEYTLKALILLFGFAVNSYLGFLGLVIGDFRVKKHEGSSFRDCHKKQIKELLEAKQKGDVSIYVGLALFALFGVFMVLICAVGQKPRNTWVSPRTYKVPTSQKTN